MIEATNDRKQDYFEKYEEPTHHINALLSASVISLDIRPRLLFPLWDAGIRTVADLIRAHRSGLARLRNIGVWGATDISELLRRFNLDSLL